MHPLIYAALPLLAIASPPADGPRLKVCLVSGSEEYRSDETLSRFAEELAANHPVECTLLQAKDVQNLPGTEALAGCDIALFFTRRLEIQGESLEDVKKYALHSGKPIVGLRTASHGFQNWLEMDRLIFGGSYQGHYRNELTTEVRVAEGAVDHPVLRGFQPFTSKGSLYKVLPLAPDCTVLLSGTSPEATQPPAWVRQHNGARVLYTSLGHPDDFAEPAFRRFLARAILWAAENRTPPCDAFK